MKKDIYEIIKKDFTLTVFNELKRSDIFEKILIAIKIKIFFFNILFIGLLADLIISHDAQVRNAIEVLIMVLLTFRISNLYKKKNSVKVVIEKTHQPSIEEMSSVLIKIFTKSFLNKSFDKFKETNISQSMRYKILSSESKEDISKINTYNDVIRIIAKELPSKVKLIF